ncbi:MAG: hypothetical protein ACKO15_10465, partial [Burkholderiales bacterium]
TYPLVGPKVYSLRQLIEFVVLISGKKRLVIGLGARLSALQATVFEFLPGRIMTRDNVASMQTPNTSSEPFPAIFGRPAAMEDTVYAYLHADGGRGRYQHFRKGIAVDSHRIPADKS